MKRAFLVLLAVLVMPISLAQEAPTTICHLPPGSPESPEILKVGGISLDAHLNHGDFVGPCSYDNFIDAGKTPDTVFWSADILLEKISISLASNQTKISQSRVLILLERLSEMNEMGKEEKYESLARAQGAYLGTIDDLEDDLERTENLSFDFIGEDVKLEVLIEEARFALAMLHKEYYDKVNKDGKEGFTRMLEATESVYEKKIELRESIKSEVTEQTNMSLLELDTEFFLLKEEYREEFPDIDNLRDEKSELLIELENRIKAELQEEIEEEVAERLDQITLAP